MCVQHLLVDRQPASHGLVVRPAFREVIHVCVALVLLGPPLVDRDFDERKFFGLTQSAEYAREVDLIFPTQNTRLSSPPMHAGTPRSLPALIYYRHNARTARADPRNLHHLRSRHAVLRLLNSAAWPAAALDHRHLHVTRGRDALGRSVEGAH